MEQRDREPEELDRAGLPVPGRLVTPAPPGMSADRAAAFAVVWEGLLSYACDNGESLRTVFRQALYLDIHRRFIHLHGHDVDDGPLEL